MYDDGKMDGADDLSDCFDFDQNPIPFQAISAPLDAAHFLNDPSTPLDPDDDESRSTSASIRRHREQGLLTHIPCSTEKVPFRVFFWPDPFLFHASQASKLSNRKQLGRQFPRFAPRCKTSGNRVLGVTLAL